MAKNYINKINAINPETGAEEAYDIVPEGIGIFLSMDTDGVTPKNLKIAPSLDYYTKGHLNLEPAKDLRIKAADDICFYSDHTDDLSEVLVKALCGVTLGPDGITKIERDKDLPIRLKVNSSEVEFNTKGVEDPNSFDVKFKNGVSSSETGEHYPQVKLKGRSFDIRCNEHGGIALQIAGKDGDGHENKIKFESDRTSNDSATYCGEGGKGMEFGTFNTLHSSLFTKDYRFNKDGEVYAVTREMSTLPTSTGKIDYVTQDDDFKDIISSDTIHAKWEDIVYVGSQKDAIQILLEHGTGSGSGSEEEGGSEGSGSGVTALQAATIKWVDDNKASIELLRDNAFPGLVSKVGEESFEKVLDPVEEGGDPVIETVPATGLYKKIEDSIAEVTKYPIDKLSISGKGNLKIAAPTTGGINLESETGAIKLETKGDNFITFSSEKAISLDGTPTILSLSQKISSSGEFEQLPVTTFSCGLLNNFGKEIYFSSKDSKVRIVLDTLYTAVNTKLDPSTSLKKINAFTDAECTVKVDKAKQEYHFVKNTAGEIWICAINSDNQVKKYDAEGSYPVSAIQEKYSNVIFVEPTEDLSSLTKIEVGEVILSGEIGIDTIINYFNNLPETPSEPSTPSEITLSDLPTGKLSEVTIEDETISEDKVATVNDVYQAMNKMQEDYVAIVTDLMGKITELQNQVIALGGTIKDINASEEETPDPTTPTDPVEDNTDETPTDPDGDDDDPTDPTPTQPEEPEEVTPTEPEETTTPSEEETTETPSTDPDQSEEDSQDPDPVTPEEDGTEEVQTPIDPVEEDTEEEENSEPTTPEEGDDTTEEDTDNSTEDPNPETPNEDENFTVDESTEESGEDPDSTEDEEDNDGVIPSDPQS